MRLNLAPAVFFLLSVACVRGSDATDVFWDSLQALCGQAFVGQVVEGTAPGDDAFRQERLVMEVRSCSETEIRIPLHVGANRSRTWVLTRTPGGLRLKHDHRHEDGTEDVVTQYGGDARPGGSAEQQEFPADKFTAELLPAARTNVWTISIKPGQMFGYGLHREAEGRRFRLVFDLRHPVPAPPAPWGHE